MDLLQSQPEFFEYNPIDAFEILADGFEWSTQRPNEDELGLTMTGSWCDYQLTVTWHGELESIHVSCVFDVKVGMEKTAEIYAVLAMINERQWLGHFDLWSEDRLLVYRTVLPLVGGAELTRGQCETLLQNAIQACEQYYPAFQFVLWAGKTAEEAVSAAMFDTVGTA